MRFTVTPASVPHFATSLPHAEDASYWGYGSQNVYVPFAASDEPEPEDWAEQPVRPATTLAAATSAPMRIAVLVRMITGSSLNAT